MESNFINIWGMDNEVSYRKYYMGDCLNIMSFNFVMSQIVSIDTLDDYKVAIL